MKEYKVTVHDEPEDRVLVETILKGAYYSEPETVKGNIADKVGRVKFKYKDMSRREQWH